MVIMKEFGCSKSVMDEIAEVLGMTPEQLVRNALDLDVVDCARRVVEGIEKPTEHWLNFYNSHPQYPPRFVEAVMIAVRHIEINPLAFGSDREH
jgi:hypothetical protein